MQTVKVERNFQKLNDLSSVMAFRAYKQNATEDTTTPDMFIPMNSFVIIDNEINLNKKWHSVWVLAVIKEGVEIAPDFRLETETPDKTVCEIHGYNEVISFCKEQGVEQALEHYANIACRIFKDADITLSLTTDPEIENTVKVKLTIRIGTDIDSLLSLDEKFYEAVNVVISDEDREYFVKSYDLVS